MKIQTQTDIKAYKSEGFIGKYQRLIKDTVIPYQYDVLWDKADNTEKSHVVQNFINAGKALRGENTGDGFYGMVFQDSDAAKWLEAAAYSISLFPSEKLEHDADELIDIIAQAQDEDGYLNTYFTIKDKEKRWTNLLEAHELYCAGHMMEAACAYYEATGKDKLLKVMLKNTEHIYKRFITDKCGGFPGHPEIELALMKMYRLTKDKRCLELAEYFINTRGTDTYFYANEAKKRDWSVWNSDPADNAYRQSEKPVRELSEANGHAVRAVYLYTGMADLASEKDDRELFSACRRLWENITQKRMYITGGIGSTFIGEAFSVDYDLPPDTAYCETCASIGLMFFASKMLENEINGEYADIMEKAFYNTVLAGMQLDGKRFFYVNPLECVPGISGVSPTHKHDLPSRPGWYACACCPPNAARLITSFGKYAYGENADTCFCHLYAAGEVDFSNGMKLHCSTGYPYEFTVKYKILSGSGRLAVRIPAWSSKFSISKNDAELCKTPDKGYIYINVSKGDIITLALDSSVHYIYPSAKIPAVTGMAAIRRGPLIYCFEGCDNNGDVLSLSLAANGRTEISKYDGDLLGGTVSISAEAVRSEYSEYLYSEEPPREAFCTAKAIPYYTWGNRGENQMRVFMNLK